MESCAEKSKDIKVVLRQLDVFYFYGLPLFLLYAKNIGCSNFYIIYKLKFGKKVDRNWQLFYDATCVSCRNWPVVEYHSAVNICNLSKNKYKNYCLIDCLLLEKNDFVRLIPKNVTKVILLFVYNSICLEILEIFYLIC